MICVPVDPEKSLSDVMEPKTKKTNIAGGVVINQSGDVLVVSQHGTTWSLPKGHVNEGEDMVVAAKREIYEESGVKDLELIKELGTYQRYRIGKDGSDDHSELKHITMFLFRAHTDILKPVDPENPEARWVPKDRVAALLTHQKDKEFFLSVIDTI